MGGSVAAGLASRPGDGRAGRLVVLRGARRDGHGQPPKKKPVTPPTIVVEQAVGRGGRRRAGRRRRRTRRSGRRWVGPVGLVGRLGDGSSPGRGRRRSSGGVGSAVGVEVGSGSARGRRRRAWASVCGVGFGRRRSRRRPWVGRGLASASAVGFGSRSTVVAALVGEQDGPHLLAGRALVGADADDVPGLAQDVGAVAGRVHEHLVDRRPSRCRPGSCSSRCSRRRPCSSSRWRRACRRPCRSPGWRG